MPHLPLLSASEVCRALERAGFFRKSQRGSHAKTRHPDGRTAIVPMHNEVAIGTLQSTYHGLRETPGLGGEFVARDPWSGWRG